MPFVPVQAHQLPIGNHMVLQTCLFLAHILHPLVHWWDQSMCQKQRGGWDQGKQCLSRCRTGRPWFQPLTGCDTCKSSQKFSVFNTNIVITLYNFTKPSNGPFTAYCKLCTWDDVQVPQTPSLATPQARTQMVLKQLLSRFYNWSSLEPVQQIVPYIKVHLIFGFPCTVKIC